MSRRGRIVLGVSVLSALIISAFAATNASAWTWYTCAPSGNGFSDAHCVNAGGSGHSHVSVNNHVVTLVSLGNENTASETTAARASKLRGVAGGVETEVQCTTVGGTAESENFEVGPEMVGTLSGAVIEYSGCTVTKPAGKGCVVSGGNISTKALSATSQGLTEQLKFTPGEGTEFASVKIESCSVAGLNNTFPVTGSVIVAGSGPTLTSTHTEVTTQNTLKFAGQKAGLDGSLTMKMVGGNPTSHT